MLAHKLEEESITKFEFGENWLKFLAGVDEDRIEEAKNSLREMLGIDDLTGKTFLDAGSGSGLFSLAARRLGACVVSFDVDHSSVLCTRKLKEGYASDDKEWSVQQGSVLNRDFVTSLGTFDIVYSWGVLHHTGNMKMAFENIAGAVAEGGLLFIAIYNDQGWKSKLWLGVKFTYNLLPKALRPLYASLIFIPVQLLLVVKSILRLDPLFPITNWINYKKRRGMSPWRDWIDWVGGYPFEVAKVSKIEEFFKQYKFSLVKSKLTTSLGCNQVVFRKVK